MATYNHTEYIENLARAEIERREFAENFSRTETGQRHARLLAEQAQNAATLAASAPGLRSAVASLLRDSPNLPIEVAYRMAAGI